MDTSYTGLLLQSMSLACLPYCSLFALLLFSVWFRLLMPSEDDDDDNNDNEEKVICTLMIHAI